MTNLKWTGSCCDWCGSGDAELVFSGPDRLEHLPGTFRMVRCTRCGLLRQNPRLAWESLKDYYPEHYAAHAALAREEPCRLRRLDRRYGMWKQLRAVESFKRGGRLLDVGCGTGLFLEEAQRSGRWGITGIEPTDRAAAYAREALQAPVFHGRFLDVELPPATFDVVTLWHVLEHVEDPVANLRRAHHLLKEGGWLVMSVPNVESLSARLFGPYWLGWDLPRHLYLFPRKTLQVMLSTLGFSWVGVRCLTLSYASLGHSLDFWSQTWQSRYAPLRRLLLRLYYTLPIRLALVLPLWVVDRLYLSSIITVFAQKRTRATSKAQV